MKRHAGIMYDLTMSYKASMFNTLFSMLHVSKHSILLSDSLRLALEDHEHEELVPKGDCKSSNLPSDFDNPII
jgi:hypothetical protein